MALTVENLIYYLPSILFIHVRLTGVNQNRKKTPIISPEFALQLNNIML